MSCLCVFFSSLIELRPVCENIEVILDWTVFQGEGDSRQFWRINAGERLVGQCS